MINTIKQLLGLGPKIDYALLVSQGAVVLDVRSKREFTGGHIAGSINIPLDTLASHLGKLKDKGNPIITCCASGIRSAAAKNMLRSNGYTAVYNGGSWSSLQHKMN